MSTIIGILILLLIGLIVGALARFIMPGKDTMGWVPTIILGIVGSILAFFIVNLIQGNGFVLQLTPNSFGGFVAAVIGALVVLFIYNRMVAGRR